MIYRGNEKENHKGSIVKFPRGGKMVEDVLLEPVDYQIIVSLEYGLTILSAGSGEVSLVEITDADLWDETCDKKLEELMREFEEKRKSKSN